MYFYSILSITVHWIDPQISEKNSFALACRRYKGPSTFDKVTQLIIDIHTEYHWKLQKITVPDNGSNIVKAFKTYGKSDLGIDTIDGFNFFII